MNPFFTLCAKLGRSQFFPTNDLNLTVVDNKIFYIFLKIRIMNLTMSRVVRPPLHIRHAYVTTQSPVPDCRYK